MKDNKLIAEFMGFTKDSKDLYLIDDYNLRSEDEYQATYVHEMKFHTSWDWLMPVVYEIDDLFGEDDDINDRINKVHNAVLQFDMEIVYRAVVEFITDNTQI